MLRILRRLLGAWLRFGGRRTWRRRSGDRGRGADGGAATHRPRQEAESAPAQDGSTAAGPPAAPDAGWGASSIEKLLDGLDAPASGPWEGAAGGEDAARLAGFDADAVEGFLDGLDGLDGSVGPEGSGWIEGEESGGEVPENRELFEGIAGVYVQPVRQFLSLLRRGPVSREWLELARPAVEMVGRSARSLGLPGLAAPLDELEAALSRAAAAEGDASVEGARRDDVLAAARAAVDALPSALGGDGATGAGDAAVLPSFLRQIPGVGRTTVARIFGAGLTSLDLLAGAAPAELAVTSGIPLRTAERIGAAVTRHRAESRRRLAETSPRAWRRLLEEAAAALEERHAELRAAADRVERTLRRRLRDAASLRVCVLLAEMGEGQLLDEVQRLPTPGRVRRVRQFVSSSDPADGSS